jgi:ABC-type antimicrobial peptide transport system permease subunit
MMVALGTSKPKIFLMILLETVFFTLNGTPVGIFLGGVITGYFHQHGLDLSGMGREMMSNFGFSTMVYPEFPTEKLTGVMIIVISTAIISCLFPAMKALRLQPVEALRR